MRKRRIGGVLMTAAATAALALPAAPAQADDMTCHPPRYDTVHCVCVAVAGLWYDVTGGTQFECYPS